MRKMILIVVVAFLISSSFGGVLSSSAGEVKATGPADSPWPLFGHDNRNTGRSSYDTSAVNGTVRWNFTLDSDISSPVIGDGSTIYIVSSGNLYALDQDGTEKWQFNPDNTLKFSPAVASDGTIYVASNSSYLYAVNPDGTQKWSFKSNYALSASPVLGDDGTIYIIGSNIQLSAIRPSGVQKWTWGPGALERITNPPAIGNDGTIYTGVTNISLMTTKGFLYAINSNGTKKWRCRMGADLHTSPTIGKKGTIYVSCLQDMSDFLFRLYAIKTNRTKKWYIPMEDSVSWDSSLAIGSNGTIYAGTRGHKIHAIISNGTKKWNFTANGPVKSSPAVGGDGTIYTTTETGNFYAIDPNGTAKWNVSLSDKALTSPVIGSDNIYVASRNGTLYAFGGVGEKLTDEGSEGVFFTSYRWLLLAAAIVTIIAVISLTLWRKGSNGGKEIPDEEDR